MSDNFEVNMYAPVPPGESQDLGTNPNIHTGRAFDTSPPAPTPHDPRSMARLYELAAKEGNTRETLEKVSATMYMANILDDNPARIYENFDHFAQKYMGMETPPKDLYKALKDEFVFGMVNQDIGKVGFDMLTASEESWGDYRRQIEHFRKKLPKMDNVERGLVGRSLKGTMKLLPQVLESFSERTLVGLGFAAGAAPGIFASGTLLPGLLDESITLMSAFSTGFSIGGWKHAIQQEGGMLVADLSMQKDDNGNYYDPKIVKAIGSAYGVLAGAIEKVSVDAVLKGFPGAEKVIREAAHKVGIGLAATNGLGQLAGKFALRYGTMITGEATEEMTQEALQIIGEHFATVVNNDLHATGFDTPTVIDSMNRLGAVWKESAETFGTMGLLGSVTSTFQHPESNIIKMVKEATPEQLMELADKLELRTDEDSVFASDEGVRSVDENISKLEASLEELRNENVESSEQIINEQEELLARLHEQRERMRDDRPPWAKSLREYAQSQGIDDSLDPTNHVRAQIKQTFKNMDETQLDVAMLFLGTRARAVGLNVVDYAERNIRFATFDEATQKITDPDGAWRGATWFEASKAVIAASESSDFSTFIHEIGHHLTTQVVKRSDVEILKKQFGVKEEDGKLVWTEEGQERFAELFEKWFREGTAPTKEMTPLFAAVRNLLAKIVNVLRPRLNKNITQVFDNLFQKDVEAEQNVTFEAPEGVMLQKASEHKALVQDAVSRGLPVPREVLMYYYRDKWARDALKDIDLKEQRDDGFSELYATARRFRSYKEFKKHAVESWGEEFTKGVEDSWYKQVYRDAFSQRIVPSSEANRIFIDSINSVEGLKDYLDAVNFDESLESALLERITEGEIDEPVVKNAVKVMRKNPKKYRELHARSTGDKVALRQLAEEKKLDAIDEIYSREIKALEGYNPEAEIVRLSAMVDNLTTRAKLIAGKISEAKVAEQVDALQRKVTDLREKNAKIADKVKATEEALSSARKEAKGGVELKNDKIKALEEALKSARKESRANVKLIREQIRERDRLRKIREEMIKLAKQILKPVPDSIHIDQKLMIEAIQKHIDPHFRSESTIARWNAVRSYIEAHPEDVGNLSKKTISKMSKVPLNMYTIEELREVKALVDSLLGEGRAKVRAIKESRRLKAKRLSKQILDTVVSGYDKKIFKKKIDFDSPNLGPRTSHFRSLNYMFRRPTRIFDMLDGGQNFSGPIHRAFVDAINVAENKAIESRLMRRDALEEYRKELGIEESEFGKRYNIDGTIFTLDQIMDIYAKWKNERARAVLMSPKMRITEERYARLVANLEEKHIKFIDAVLKDYESHFDVFRDAVAKLTNKDIGWEPFYTPMLRLGINYKDHAEQIANEMELREGLKKAQVAARAAHKRIDVPEQFQQPIRLGLYNTWNEAVGEQEHYINYAEQVVLLRKAFHDPEVVETINAMYGKEIVEEIDKYLGRIANPNIYKTFNSMNNIVRYARSHVAVAYLAYNLVTTMKQFISLAYYMAEAGPLHLIGATFEAATNWTDMRAFVEAVSPQMRERPIYRVMEEMLAGNKEKAPGLVSKIGNRGMQVLAVADAITTTIGFKAVYDKHKGSVGHDEAVRLALNATLRTQPAAGAKDIPGVYADDNMVTLVLQFTNQLNNIWNMISYDMPMDLREGRYGHFAANFLGLGIGSLLMYMLTTRSLPDEDDEDALVYTRNAFLTQLMNSIPIAGPLILSGYKGYETDLTVLTPLKSAGRLATKLEKIRQGEELGDQELRNLIDQTWEGIAIGVGAPYIAVKRGANAFEDLSEGDLYGALQEVVIGGEVEED